MSHQAASPPQSENLPQRAPNIYLVDDDLSFLRALFRRLRAADYQVEAFGSAEEFLSRRRSEAAACVVLDLQMSGSGGLELQEALPRPKNGDVSSSVRAMKVRRGGFPDEAGAGG